ncbi:hypothetical protein Tsubulata_037321 [Turnera subulata]|uniref:Uncharacterized protein n=1 Tax=Turnera subulata TaxID=218843 RepID=A0A9Q0JFQ1_9ROSI|nr:hypothetical protein Tsubulata_037321 [Turnera subulata]
MQKGDDEQEASDVEMDSQFWHDSTGGYGFNDNEEEREPPYFVRRWAPKSAIIRGRIGKVGFPGQQLKEEEL